MGKAAYIIIDIQNDYFPDGLFPLENIKESSEKAAEFLEFVRDHNSKASNKDDEIKIIHVHHEFPAGGPFFITGSKGAEINKVVEPKSDETKVIKSHPNSFVETNLQEILKDNDIETLYVSGAMANLCIQGTVRNASELGYKVTVLRDAIGSRPFEYDGHVVSAEDVKNTVFATIAFGYGELKDTSAIIASLK